MNWFSSMFSVSTVGKVVDGVISAGDKMFYTDEEKADMRLKTGKLHIEMLKAYSPFKITQRFLALWYSFLFGISFLIGLGMTVFNIIIIYKTPTATILNLKPLIEFVSAIGISGIVLAIVVFYFGGGSIESFKRLL